MLWVVALFACALLWSGLIWRLPAAALLTCRVLWSSVAWSGADQSGADCDRHELRPDSSGQLLLRAPKLRPIRHAEEADRIDSLYISICVSVLRLRLARTMIMMMMGRQREQRPSGLARGREIGGCKHISRPK